VNDDTQPVIGPLLGEDAPRFILETTQNEAALDTMLERGKVILAFIKDASSPHCRSLLGLLQDFQPQFSAAGASVIAVSPNDMDTVRTLTNELKLTFPVAPDPELTVARAYEVAGDRNTGPSRSVFVIDPDGMIVLSIENYHPANISQLEAIFLSLEIAEESPPMLQRPNQGGLLRRVLGWF
jgi:peroxiredoxin